MDECIPPVLRDNKYFMYPFFWFAYRGRDVSATMEFKARVHQMSDAEYSAFYAGLDSISRNRETDLNEPCLQRILALLDDNVASLIDVGCGGGYLLRKIHQARPGILLSGCDIIEQDSDFPFAYLQCDVRKLPAQLSCDVITCTHTLEHVLDLQNVVARLRTICRKFLVIVVPCQRYFRYTLDEHVHFFTHEYQLAPMLGVAQSELVLCEKLGGDWVLVVEATQ